MSLFNKIFLLVLACLSLSHCGFHPLYKQYDVAESAVHLCSIEVPFKGGNRTEQAVWARLEDLVNNACSNTPSEKKYVLTFTIEEGKEAIAIQKDGVNTRSKLAITYRYTLQHKEDAKLATEGKGRLINSVDVIAASEFASYIAEKDSKKNIALEVAEAIQTHILLFLKTNS